MGRFDHLNIVDTAGARVEVIRFSYSLFSAAVGSPSVWGLRRFAAGSQQAQSPVHLEDEPFCRQRQVVVLGNRVPVLSPDVWVAPNAIIVGDVDLFDRVRPPSPSYLTLHVALSLLGVLRNQCCAWRCLLAMQVSIWYGCVLRGDLNNIKVGAFSNIQDRTMIHAAR